MLKTAAFAKLDLAIHIDPKKKPDGYFPVHYVDCQIDIQDQLSFKKQERQIEVICDDPAVPEGKDNFVFKAATLFKKAVGDRQLGVKIKISKNIPIRAGFGGGSSDAAATILGLSRLWKIMPSEDQKKSISRLLGKDFYYSLYGGLSEIVGDGKNYKVTALSSHLPSFGLLVVVPREQKPSTAWVYENLNPRDIGRNFGKFEKLKTAVLKNDKIGILKNLTNDFEILVSSKFPIVDELKTSLMRVGAKAVIMAGSGLSVVGFFDSIGGAQAAKNKLKNMRGIKQIITARTIN